MKHLWVAILILASLLCWGDDGPRPLSRAQADALYVGRESLKSVPDLIEAPILQFYGQTSGSSSVNATTGIGDNRDGSNSGVYFNVANTTGAYGIAWLNVAHTSTIGIRWRYGASPFSVSVDGGRLKRVNATTDYLIQELVTPTFYELRAIVATGLDPNRPHYVKIYFGQNTSGIVTGLLVDKGAGYIPIARNVIPSYSSLDAAVPTTYASIAPHWTSGSSSTLKWVSKIIYSNPTAGAITITWQTASTTCMTKTLAAGEVWTQDFNPPLQTSTLQHKADGAGATVTYFGGCF